MENELNTIYKYFSHHIRNATAMIAASVTLMSYKMAPEENDLLAEVNEASFLLDLFDAGMNICFRHVFRHSPPEADGAYPLEGFVSHFVEQMKLTLRERGVQVKLSASGEAVISGSGHELKTIIGMILYEMILQTKSMLSVTLTNGELQIYPDSVQCPPEVWLILKDLLACRKVFFTYDGAFCKLRFPL